MAGWAAWLVWWGLLAVWTVGLLLPQPLPGSGLQLSSAARFVLSKTCHVAAYAVLAGMLVWLPGPSSLRWALVALLSGHGCGTELLQRFIPPRTGSLGDVALDHLGIGLGWLLTWWWQMFPGSRSKQASRPPGSPDLG